MTRSAFLVGFFLSAATLTATACSDDAESAGSATAAATTTATSSGTGGDPYAALYACDEAHFLEARPLTGPGYDPAKGGILGTPLPSYVVHTTQIYAREGKMGDLLKASAEVQKQLDATEGLVAYTLGVDTKCGVARTLGVWASEDAMYAFVASDAHAAAMAQTHTLAATGRVAHWEVTADGVAALSWEVARAKLADVDPSPVFDAE